MGGSVSQLSKENAALITKTLRAESDALATSGLSDEVIFERLAAKYETFLHEHVSDLKMGWEPAQDVTPAPLKKTNSKVDKKAQDELIIRLQVKSNFAFKPTLLVRQTSNARPLSSSGNKKSEQGPASPAPKSRRRSFAVPLPKIDESAAKVNAEPDIPVGVDSWDSVTQQPFCSICMMAFKSGSALERHEKFSRFTPFLILNELKM